MSITRLHEAAVAMKRLAIVVFAVECGMVSYLEDVIFFVLTLAVIIALTLLDTKSLQFERVYLTLYDQIRVQPLGESASFVLTPKNATHCP